MKTVILGKTGEQQKERKQYILAAIETKFTRNRKNIHLKKHSQCNHLWFCNSNNFKYEFNRISTSLFKIDCFFHFSNFAVVLLFILTSSINMIELVSPSFSLFDCRLDRKRWRIVLTRPNNNNYTATLVIECNHKEDYFLTWGL